MGDYFKHWLRMGNKTSPDKLPKIFYVNWFRKSPTGELLWPGFGDNSRVLKWIIQRCKGEADAFVTPIGYLPRLCDIDLKGLKIDSENMNQLLNVDIEQWQAELPEIKEHLATLGGHLPEELWEEYSRLRERLNRATVSA
jgi:phosphoenolpyruvate carboxykinase (GTP)